MIWCAGECLYDIVFKNGSPQWAVAGGSMMNAAVSAARSGMEVSLITELGNDAVGELITGFLNSDGVSTRHVTYYQGNTTLALAFLNERGDAQYQFYHHSPEEAPDFSLPEFRQGDVLLFGSFYSVRPRNRANIRRLATAARDAGAWIFYDPNFRKPHLNELPLTLPFIAENIGMADFVRGSDEDFQLIAGAANPDEAYAFVHKHGCSKFILTRNSRGVEVFTGSATLHVDSRKVEVISTIGAGDSFNAGFATVLHGKSPGEINAAFWDEATGRAVIFATEVCQSRENFIGRRSL